MSTAKDASRSDTKLTDFVGETIQNYQLIADYFQRPSMNDVFMKKVNKVAETNYPRDVVKLNNGYFPTWLEAVFVSVYMITEANDVVNDPGKLGTFLASMTVFGELTSNMNLIYDVFLGITESFHTLKMATVKLNLKIDVPEWKTICNNRRRLTHEILSDPKHNLISCESSRSQTWQFMVPECDMMPLRLQDVAFSYTNGPDVFCKINLCVSQGSLVAIWSEAGLGRRTFLRMLAHTRFPTQGEVFFPAHLRVLFVSQNVFLFNMPVMNNVLFGYGKAATDNAAIDDFDDAELHDRVLLILEKLKAWKALDMYAEDVREACAVPFSATNVSGPGAGPGSGHMQRHTHLESLSSTERAKIHLARAFIVNPEVMILQRPMSHYSSEEDEQRVLTLIREHINNRGLGMPPETAHRRRPRTVFMSMENEDQHADADVVWRFDGLEVNEEQPPKASSRRLSFRLADAEALARGTPSRYSGNQQSTASQRSRAKQDLTQVANPPPEKEASNTSLSGRLLDLLPREMSPFGSVRRENTPTGVRRENTPTGLHQELPLGGASLRREVTPTRAGLKAPSGHTVTC